MQFTVPDGLKISGIEVGNAYTNNNEYTWNGDEYVLVWASADGEVQTAQSGATIVTLLVDVPANTPDGTVFPVEFVEGSVTVSGADEIMLEHEEVNGSITVRVTDAGDIVFNIGSASGEPGDTVNVPLLVGFDKGSSSFEIQLDVPDGLTIEDFVIDPDSVYAQNGVFTWDPDTKTLTWTSTTGENVAGDPNTKIGDIVIKISDDAESGAELTVTGVGSAVNSDGNNMTPHVTDGLVTVTEPRNDDIYIVTALELTYTPPTRVNYWSHDTRAFSEIGFTDMVAAIRVTKYYVNADNQFVNAAGEVISDATYDAAGTIPADVTPFFDKTKPVNEFVHPVIAAGDDLRVEDTPLEVWERQLIDIYGDDYISPQEGTSSRELWLARQEQLEAADLQNQHTLGMYYFSDEQGDADFVIGDGSPLYLGDYNIFIGVKGDTDLSNRVDVIDAQLGLIYYVEKIVAELDDIYLVANDGMGDVDELRYYLSDVKYLDKNGNMVNPTEFDVEDCIRILQYYVETDVAELYYVTWEDIVGYDLLDSFYGD